VVGIVRDPMLAYSHIRAHHTVLLSQLRNVSNVNSKYCSMKVTFHTLAGRYMPVQNTQA